MPSKTPHLKSYRESTLPNEMLDFWLSKFNPVWSVEKKLGKLIRKKQEAKGTFTLYFKVNRRTQLPQAGQHIDTIVEVNGRCLARTYSPTHVDKKNRILGITVKKVRNGNVSEHLIHALPIDGVVHFGKTYGNFTWPMPKKPVQLIAGGSGITPFISLLTENINLKQPIRLDYWCKNRADACFIKKLLSWQEQFPNFQFYLHLTQEGAEKPYEKEGRITEDFVKRLGKLDNTYLIACGTSDFTNAAKKLLEDKVKSFSSEAFSPPTYSPQDEEENEDGSEYTITLLKQNKVITVRKGQPILSALLENNIACAYGCRIGICNTCTCHKVSGQTKSTLNSEIDSKENLSFRVCVELAKSDIVLDI